LRPGRWKKKETSLGFGPTLSVHDKSDLLSRKRGGKGEGKKLKKRKKKWAENGIGRKSPILSTSGLRTGGKGDRRDKWEPPTL